MTGGRRGSNQRYVYDARFAGTPRLCGAILVLRAELASDSSLAGGLPYVFPPLWDIALELPFVNRVLHCIVGIGLIAHLFPVFTVVNAFIYRGNN